MRRFSIGDRVVCKTRGYLGKGGLIVSFTDTGLSARIRLDGDRSLRTLRIQSLSAEQPNLNRRPITREVQQDRAQPVMVEAEAATVVEPDEAIDGIIDTVCELLVRLGLDPTDNADFETIATGMIRSKRRLNVSDQGE